MSHATVAVLAIALAGCSNSRSPGAPSPFPAQGASAIAGVVLDTAYRYVAGARVEVVNGPQAGMAANTNAEGQFTMTGVFDDTTQFVATKDGHLPATSTLRPFCAPCNPNRWVFFNLEEFVPPANLAGDWQVTFVTDSACTGVPGDLRTRSYDATIALAPPAGNPDARWLFVVTMKNVPFLSSYKDFHIGVAGSDLGFPESEGPVLVEQLGPATYLSFNSLGWNGNRAIRATAGSTITTGFNATEYCVLTAPFAGTAFECPAGSSLVHSECEGNNRLTLIRR